MKTIKVKAVDFGGGIENIMTQVLRQKYNVVFRTGHALKG